MLSIGDIVSPFSLIDQHGDHRSSEELSRSGWMLVYFYPADSTPLCTAQACMGRDHQTELLSAGVSLVGISRQDQESKRKFADQHKLQFVLLADTDRVVQRQFGVLALGELVTRRVSFLVQREADGRLIIRDRHESNFALAGHADFVNRALQRVREAAVKLAGS